MKSQISRRRNYDRPNVISADEWVGRHREKKEGWGFLCYPSAVRQSRYMPSNGVINYTVIFGWPQAAAAASVPRFTATRPRLLVALERVRLAVLSRSVAARSSDSCPHKIAAARQRGTRTSPSLSRAFVGSLNVRRRPDNSRIPGRLAAQQRERSPHPDQIPAKPLGTLGPQNYARTGVPPSAFCCANPTERTLCLRTPGS